MSHAGTTGRRQSTTREVPRGAPVKRAARASALLFLLLLMALPPTAPASGDAVGAGADARFAQSIAGTELTVVVRSVSRLPAALPVEITAYRPVPDLPVHLTIRSQETGESSQATVRLRSGRPGTYRTRLAVDRAGPHELELRAGGERSVLPLRVLVAGSSPMEFAIHGGIYLAGALLLGGLLTGGLSRRRSAVAVYGGAALGIAALTTALVSPMLPPPVPEGAEPPPPPGTAAEPSYLIARFSTEPERPVTGTDFTLRVDLVDGATGLPVDDLAGYHQALAHLVVVGDGGYFRHLHPLVAGPGRLETRLRADRPGRYRAYAEVRRAGSGTQLLAGDLTVAGESAERADDETSTDTAVSTAGSTAGGAAATAGGAASHSHAGTPGGSGDATPEATSSAVPYRTRPAGEPVLTPARPVAGRPVTIELDTGRADVQPWLGMPGHLIVRDESGDFLGHVHESGMITDPNTPPVEEGSAIFGPKLRFTYTFPAPGRYLAWLQYARGFRIETVPFVITVGQ